jgi:hypothetical protein
LLRRVVRHKEGLEGELSTVLITDATSVELGGDANAHFAVPAWKERSPSAVLAEYERKFGISSSTHDLEGREMKDKAYYASQTIR